MVRVFISFAADNAEPLQLKLSLANDVAGLRALAERVASGSELWGDWARSRGGQQITRDFVTGRIEIPAEHLGDIPKLREAYQDQTGLSCSVGIGRLPAEADNALQYAGLHGGDRAVFWREEYREELAKAKQNQEELNKAEGGIEPQPQPQLHKTDKQPERVSKKIRLADRFHAIAKRAAGSNLMKEPAKALPDNIPELANPNPPNPKSAPEQDSEENKNDSLRAQLTQVLLRVKDQAPMLEKIRSTNPKAYEAVVGSIQAMLAMAKQLNQGGEVQKSEDSKPCRCNAYHFPHRFGGGSCKGEMSKDEPQVYRIEGQNGLGPYRIGAGDSETLREAIERLRYMPPPTRDFDPMKFGRHPLVHKFVYGFPSLQAASEFLGGGLLDRLAKEGYQLRKFTPKKGVFVGRSGKQVAFLRDPDDRGELVDTSDPNLANLFKSEDSAVYVLWHPAHGYLNWHALSDHEKVEQDPADGAPSQWQIAKTAISEHRLANPHLNAPMPVGTKKDGPAAGQGHRNMGQIKIDPDPYDNVPPEHLHARYVQVRAGMIRSNKLGTPISSRSINR